MQLSGSLKELPQKESGSRLHFSSINHKYAFGSNCLWDKWQQETITRWAGFRRSSFLTETANRWQLMPWEWLPIKYPETATSQSHDLSSSHLCIFRIGRRMRGCTVGLCKRIESVYKYGQQERVGLFHQGAESLTRGHVTGILHLAWFPACCLAWTNVCMYFFSIKLT